MSRRVPIQGDLSSRFQLFGNVKLIIFHGDPKVKRIHNAGIHRVPTNVHVKMVSSVSLPRYGFC